MSSPTAIARETARHWGGGLKAALAALALVFSVACPQDGAKAQETWPTRPVKLVVPLAAGGGVDLVARIVAERLSAQLGQQVIVENQGGGGGTIATANVARSAADGYTLIFQSNSAAINPLVYKKLPYDGVNGFTPVTVVAQFPLVAVVPASLPAKTLPEFIALLKANPGKYSYASSGVGTITQLAAENFKRLAGVDMVHVPYRGNAAALSDLIAGRVELLFDGVAPQIGNIQAGTLRALGVTTAERSKVLPDVPSIREIVPGYEIPFWTAIFAPAGTPAAIVQRVAAETAAALKQPDVVRRLAELGIEGVGSSPESAAQFWRQQLAYFGQIVRDANVNLGDAPQ